MSFRLFRFRRLSIRLLVILLGLIFAALTTTRKLVSHFNDLTAREHAEANLELGARIYQEAARQRIENLTSNASLMSGDYTIRQLLLKPEPDRQTLASLLRSYTQRIGSPVIALFDTKKVLVANSEPAMANENVGPFQFLIGHADDDPPETNGFSYLDGRLHVLVVVPLYAPVPHVAAWFGLAFPIDRTFARKIKILTRLEVTFVSTEDPAHPRVLATTLGDDAANLVAHAAVDNLHTPAGIEDLDVLGDRYVTLFKTQEMLAEAAITVVLQRPLSTELAAARELENYIVLVSLATLAVATLAAFWIARGVSQPVQQLAAHTHVIAGGDYTTRIALDRVDELGQLADAMNRMSAGLAERDRVRDLLDKNVSPEVAAQLMRDGGAALGGEEREVTILFADLRGFTTLSEKLPPRELLTLLNRYLDRMSAEIEQQGGVIDKFIGDAIMALFGAPVAQGDAAERALAAALAMERALVALNAELAAEGRPPLAIGIGVNTARVVAGNIGSHRRLNYSVIGDGVNVAARLQSETRKPEHRTSVITSAATVAACHHGAGSLPASSAPTPVARAIRFRPLGPVQVKGRAEAVEIFAVEA